MAFMLYSVDNQSYSFEFELRGQMSLWGKNGIVAKCAIALDRISSQGPWSITEREILDSINQDDNTAILDDLVPKGPEVLVGRIKTISGFLDHSCTSDPNDRYNPILITMEELLSVAPGPGLVERYKMKQVIAFPSQPPKIIRSVNYLVHSWRPSGTFRGALLWERHWNHLGPA